MENKEMGTPEITRAEIEEIIALEQSIKEELERLRILEEYKHLPPMVLDKLL